MTSFTQFNDQQLIDLISSGNKEAFEFLFRKFIHELYRLSVKYVRNKEVAEELVHDVFLNVWEKAGNIELKGSIKNYLYTSVKNRSINFLQREFAKLKLNEEVPETVISQFGNSEEEYIGAELNSVIGKAMDLLPEKCRIIFSMSRKMGLTYKEIAGELNISQKTVETQMGIALRKVKEYIEIHWDKAVTLVLALINFF